MRKVFLIWFFIVLIIAFGYFMYNMIGKEKKSDANDDNPVTITRSFNTYVCS